MRGKKRGRVGVFSNGVEEKKSTNSLALIHLNHQTKVAEKYVKVDIIIIIVRKV